jgi:hypothetical protein
VAVPDLERHCGSWVIVRRATGESVFETFSRATAQAVNQRNYEVITALQWLVRLNTALRTSFPAEYLRNAVVKHHEVSSPSTDATRSAIEVPDSGDIKISEEFGWSAGTPIFESEMLC